MLTGSATAKLEKLYLSYNKVMYKVAYGILNDHQLAQDAVQMAFVKIIDNVEKIDEVDYIIILISFTIYKH